MKKDQLKFAKTLKKTIGDMVKAKEKELRELREQYIELEFFIDGYMNSYESKVEQNKNKVKTKEVVDNSSKEAVAEAAYKLVKMRGDRIMRDELYDLLIEQGIVINGKNPKMILSTMLWRVKPSKLVRLKGGGYWLKDKRYDAENYIPEEIEYQSNSSKQLDLINPK